MRGVRKFERYSDALDIEGSIHLRFHRKGHYRAITTGFACGAAIISAAKHGLSITEYPPSCVKLATVGRGAAAKAQLAFMLRAMLELTETPAPDAADALAIALTHLAASDPLRSHLFEGGKSAKHQRANPSPKRASYRQYQAA